MFDANGLISPQDFYSAFINGWIVDGRSGGLIRGRSHTEGHVIMIGPTNVLGQFKLVGYAEGDEYLLNTQATHKYFQRIVEINQNPPSQPIPFDYKLTKHTRILDTRADRHDKLLIVYEQYVINTHSTSLYFEELEKMNSEFNHHNGLLFTDAEINFFKSLKF